MLRFKTQNEKQNKVCIQWFSLQRFGGIDDGLFQII